MKQSLSEKLMIQVLKEYPNGLTLNEIVHKIQILNKDILTGENPNKSLYSVIYRRGNKRKENGELPLFLANKDRRDTLYFLNHEVLEND